MALEECCVRLRSECSCVKAEQNGRNRFLTDGSPAAKELKSSACAGICCAAAIECGARQRLLGLLGASLTTVRACMVKETFRDFRRYRSLIWAGAFLDVWTARAMRSRIEPMKKLTQMLRSHRELLLTWFRAKGEVSAAAVQGLNRTTGFEW